MTLLVSQAERLFHFFSHWHLIVNRGSTQESTSGSTTECCRTAIHVQAPFQVKKKIPSDSSREPTTWISLLLEHSQWLHRIRRMLSLSCFMPVLSWSLLFCFVYSQRTAYQRRVMDLCRCSSLSKPKTVVRAPNPNLIMLFFLCCLLFPPSSKLLFVALLFCFLTLNPQAQYSNTF